ncbi:hypothetical protein VNO77_42208 [Canavalia gladiata]|uniref:Uncharacterized protein n=1 Tax=Canavalia gladiata TaxID=3824 RepID=A0AAN9K3N6_CANGL
MKWLSTSFMLVIKDLTQLSPFSLPGTEVVEIDFDFEQSNGTKIEVGEANSTVIANIGIMTKFDTVQRCNLQINHDDHEIDYHYHIGYSNYMEAQFNFGLGGREKDWVKSGIIVMRHIHAKN